MRWLEVAMDAIVFKNSGMLSLSKKQKLTLLWPAVRLEKHFCIQLGTMPSWFDIVVQEVRAIQRRLQCLQQEGGRSKRILNENKLSKILEETLEKAQIATEATI